MNYRVMLDVQNICSVGHHLVFRPWKRCRRQSFFSITLGVILLFGSIGCGKGGSPPPNSRMAERERTASIELAALSQRETGSSSSAETGRGFTYKNDWVSAVPWSIHLVAIDRSRSDLALTTALSNDRILGLAPLTEHIQTIPSARGRPVAAVSGDFYSVDHQPYAGDPRGLQILNGELVSGPGGDACFWIDAEGNPHISNIASQFKVTWPAGQNVSCGLNEERNSSEAVLYTSRLGPSTRTSGGREIILERAGENAWLPLRAGQNYSAQVREVREAGNTRLTSEMMVLSLGPSLAARLPRLERGSLVKISTATSPDLTGAPTAIGGGPHIVRDGRVQSSYEHKASSRHPRTAIGWNSKHYFFVVVDGRQRGLSVGMTLPELGSYLVRQGCQEAMNLDGGGSAEMWIEGRVVSSPCYGYERDTANSLVLLRTSKPE
jgi:hypothetical protein